MIYTTKEAQKQLLDIFESMEKDISLLFDSLDELKTNITPETFDSFLNHLYFFQSLVILHCRILCYEDSNLTDTVAVLKAKYPEKFGGLPDFDILRELIKLDERNLYTLNDLMLGLEPQLSEINLSSYRPLQ